MKSSKMRRTKLSTLTVLALSGVFTFTGCGVVSNQSPSPAPPVTTPTPTRVPVAETATPTITPSATPTNPSSNSSESTTPTPTPSLSPTPTPSPSPTTSPSATPSPSPTPTKPVTDEKALELEKENIKTHAPVTRYAITDLNVRSGPGSKYSIIDSLNKGDEVQIDATIENWQRLEGTSYWVSSGYLNKSKPVDLSQVAKQKQQGELETIAKKYGCPTVTVILDDPRLGSITNAKADWGANSIFFRSTAPKSRWDYLMAHECSHLLQYSIYGGDIDALQSDMNKLYGGSNYEGLEQNSDCFVFAVNPKNTQWHYTQECTGKRLEGARSILRGQKPKIG